MTAKWKQWEGKVADGKFLLRQFLGDSDQSAVFLTERGPQKQQAAIKLISANPKNMELQLSRWKSAEDLSHPHLLSLFEMGRCSLDETELLYLVMEYAEENLAQILPQRPLTPAESQDMLPPVLDALAYLHSKGFVHGHLKPGNILAVSDQLKISSDGLCRVGELGTDLGKSDIYMPPEIASGGMTSSSDIWALGATLVEVLTQHPPTWEKASQTEPVVPKTIPEPFLDIANRCLLRNPQHRWTVAEIAARLRPAPPVAQKQTSAKPPSVSVKRRYMVPLVAAGILLLVLLIAPRVLNRQSGNPQGNSVASAPQNEQPEPKQTQATRSTKKNKMRTGKEQSGTAASPALPSSEAGRTSTAGQVQGSVVQQVLPDVLQSARDTIQGRIRVSVKVMVDPSGNVAGTTLDSAGPSKYFARLALQAAQRWKFAPAKVDGQGVPSEWILRFEFQKTATNVYPVLKTR